MGPSDAAGGAYGIRALGRVTLTAVVFVLVQALTACHVPRPSGSALAAAGGECKGETKPLPPSHRLNNAEYDATIHDLLGTKQSYAGSFPPDQVANGFDTAAGAHVISPTMAESYLDAARLLSKDHAEKVVGDCRSGGGGGDDVACLDAALLEVAEKAFRRPLLSDESRQIATLAQRLRGDGSSAREAFEAGLAGVLMAPHACDLTRVGTFMVANEASNIAYDFAGVSRGHHDVSHDDTERGRQDLAAIVKWHIGQLAAFLAKLKAANMLDDTLVVFGAGLGNGARHDHDNLAILVAGRARVLVPGGRHIEAKDAPLSNLHLTLAQALGASWSMFGESTAALGLA